jgi:hypothetical protein
MLRRLLLRFAGRAMELEGRGMPGPGEAGGEVAMVMVAEMRIAYEVVVSGWHAAQERAQQFACSGGRAKGKKKITMPLRQGGGNSPSLHALMSVQLRSAQKLALGVDSS